MKRWKSDCGVKARTSSSVGGGGAAAGCSGGETSAGWAEAGSAGGGSAAASGGAGSSSGLPSRTSCLRRAQRPRKPSAMFAPAEFLFGADGGRIAEAVRQRLEAVRPLALLGLDHVVLV